MTGPVFTVERIGELSYVLRDGLCISSGVPFMVAHRICTRLNRVAAEQASDPEAAALLAALVRGLVEHSHAERAAARERIAARIEADRRFGQPHYGHPSEPDPQEPPAKAPSGPPAPSTAAGVGVVEVRATLPDGTPLASWARDARGRLVEVEPPEPRCHKCGSVTSHCLGEPYDCRARPGRGWAQCDPRRFSPFVRYVMEGRGMMPELDEPPTMTGPSPHPGAEPHEWVCCGVGDVGAEYGGMRESLCCARLVCARCGVQQ